MTCSHARTTPAHIARFTGHRRGCTGRRLVITSIACAALMLLAASPALAISRNTVLSRAQVRVDRPVAYSQSRYYAGYRTDCSGYVSMCWATGTSYNTRTMYLVTTPIRSSALKPGDAMLRPGYHVRLFYGWLDEAHTHYVAYETAGSIVSGVRIHSLSEDLKAGYKPVRYDRITDSAAPQSVLKNGTFNTWARQWGASTDQPVWWQVSAPWGTIMATRRQDVYRTARNSLKLVNGSADPLVRNELWQEARVVPGADYRLTAYARSATASSAIEVRLAYLDAFGAALVETSTTGARVRIDGAGFKPMTLLATAPTETARARVTISLAGGTATSTAGIPTTGTAMFLDDVSLIRPRLTVGARTNDATAVRGQTITLSGTVWPRSSVGATTTVYARKPGGSWHRYATTHVAASGSSAIWSSRYTFKNTMPRGTYSFRAYVSPIPGYLGTTSKTVYVGY